MRGNPYRHKYKFGKQTEKISFQEFENILESCNHVDPIRDKAFLTILYYLACRVTALLLLKREDIKIERGEVFFKLEALKGGIRNAPLKLPLDLPYISVFLEYLRQTKFSRENQIFPFSYVTAWRIVKRAFPRKYPHFFRLNRCTHFLDDPSATLPEIKTWFGWKRIETVNAYIGYSDRHIDKGIRRIEREVST